jgi:hypothetical protein
MVAGGANGEPGWALLACRVFDSLVQRRRLIMDAHRFDSVVKALRSGSSRRRVLRGLLASSVAGAVGVSRTFDAQAGKSCSTSSDCPTNQLCRRNSAGNLKCTGCGKLGPSDGGGSGTFGCHSDSTLDGGFCCTRGDQVCCLCPGVTVATCQNTNGGTLTCSDYGTSEGSCTSA